MDRHKLSIYLMTASLVLLAVFLFLFLEKTYREEIGELKKETSFLFINSVRGIEGKMLDRLLVGDLNWESKGAAHKFIFDHKIDHKDSLKVVVTDERRLKLLPGDSAVQISIRTEKNEKGETDMSGSLSMVIAMEVSDSMNDTVIMKKAPNILPMLKENFEKSIAGEKKPFHTKIVRITHDSLPPPGAMLTGSYTDLPSGERFGVEVAGFQAYIFRQMLPQMLFSLALFSCVSLAFFTVFKNLQTQKRLAELKNDFIQNVTHELKTPIATVGVAIEALRDFDAAANPKRSREYLDISKNELNRLSLLVDKVLRMSLFEKSEPVLKVENLDLATLVESVLSSMKLQFEKLGATMVFDKNGSDFAMNGDTLHLTSVVYNLVDNALKYSLLHPKIQIACRSEKEHLILEISDNGIGIPEAYQGKIFDKFFRVPSGNVHNVKGHGLGLSYVASVVKKHKGSITVKSQEGEGTAFTVMLPKN